MDFEKKISPEVSLVFAKVVIAIVLDLEAIIINNNFSILVF